jgi:hypothetical protein
MWENLNCACAARSKGVSLSARSPSYAAFSATSTLEIPPSFATCAHKKLESLVRGILYYKHLSNPANYCHLCTKKRVILWLQNLNNPANSHNLFTKKP